MLKEKDRFENLFVGSPDMGNGDYAIDAALEVLESKDGFGSAAQLVRNVVVIAPFLKETYCVDTGLVWDMPNELIKFFRDKAFKKAEEILDVPFDGFIEQVGYAEQIVYDWDKETVWVLLNMGEVFDYEMTISDMKRDMNFFSYYLDENCQMFETADFAQTGYNAVTKEDFLNFYEWFFDFFNCNESIVSEWEDYILENDLQDCRMECIKSEYPCLEFDDMDGIEQENNA